VPPQEFIDLKIENKYYPFASEATGTYQLIPFYQKISFPKDGQKNTSAFVIEKNPLNGEWQITEIKSIKDDSKKKVDGIYRKKLFTEFSIQENILKPLIVAKVFETLKKEAKEMKELSINLKEKLENNTREFQTLKIENKSIKLTNKKNIQACETKLNNMNDELQKIKSENKNLLEKYQNSRKTCSELHFYENENSALKRKVKNLDEKLKKAQQENQTQLNEYQKLEEEFQKLEKEFQNKESKFENLKTNLVAKENELNYLLNKLEQNAYIEAESQTECNSEENFKIEFSSSKSEIEKEFSELSTKSEIEKDTDTNQTQSSDKETSLEIQENVKIKKKKKRNKNQKWIQLSAQNQIKKKIMLAAWDAVIFNVTIQPQETKPAIVVVH
jgi:chromosome segregation ATPase